MTSNRKASKLFFCFVAVFESGINALVGGVYVTLALKDLGVSADRIGIITSFTGVASVGMLVNLFSKSAGQKKRVLLLSVLKYSCNVLLYLSYVAGWSVLLTVLLYICSCLFWSMRTPYFNEWSFRSVDKTESGRFLGLLNIIGYAVDMPCAFLIGWYTDLHIADGTLKTAFTVFAVALTVIGLSDVICLALIPDVKNSDRDTEKRNPVKTTAAVFREKNIVTCLALYLPWWIFLYAYNSYLNLYAINEIRLSVKFIAAVGIAASFAAMLAMWFFGSFSDRGSFGKTAAVSYALAAGFCLLGAFMLPGNGKWLYPVTFVGINIATAGMNLSHSGLVFSMLSRENAAPAFSLIQCIGGAIGFCTTLVMSRLYAAVENGGNKVLGISMYSQQLNFIIAFVIAASAALITGRLLKKADDGAAA